MFEQLVFYDLPYFTRFVPFWTVLNQDSHSVTTERTRFIANVMVRNECRALEITQNLSRRARLGLLMVM